MPRYFLELTYKGTNYSGFQVQQNANSIQAEIEKAIQILLRENITLTGSSRTDSGVHAIQNYFHFDTDLPLNNWKGIEKENHFVYKMNAILPPDIAIKSLREVKAVMHCRFDAEEREYNYYIYRGKHPFLNDRAYYFPYKLDLEAMDKAAAMVKEYHDFTSFSKRNTQAKTFLCEIKRSQWEVKNHVILYNVVANRFLRGMVRALVATMLQVGRGKIGLDAFRKIIEAKDCTKASFAVPTQGLFLVAVRYPASVFN